MVVDTTRLLKIASGSLAAGEQEVEDPTGIDINRLLEIALRPAGGGVSRPRKRDVGVLGAFGAGLEKGIKEPFRLLGAEPREVELDETSEQVSNFLGSLVGLGISFVPFAAGTGLLLRGLGLTAKIAGVGVTAQEAAKSQALFNFVRNTAAGSLQFAGTAEKKEQILGRAAAGAAFGVAIEGVFLARAMRGRRGSVGKEKLFDDGSPITDKPVDIDHMVTEVEISPSVSKTPERMTLELDGTFTQNKPHEEVIADLLGEHVETARFTGLTKEGSNDILAYSKENFPTAQRLTRATQVKGVHEVLLHQPFDPANTLTKRQISEWQATGFASGERLVYANKTVEATGGISPTPGTVSVRTPLSAGTKEGTPFLAPIGEVTRPTTTRFFNRSAVRAQTLQAAVRSIDDRIGFVVPRGAGLSARRGFVDVSEFETATSFPAFAKQFTDDLATVQAASPEEAVGILAAQRGIPGLKIVDDGVTTRVHVFDQKKVGFIDEPSIAPTPSEVRPIGERPGIPPLELLIPGRRPETLGDLRRAAQAEAVDVPNLGLVLDNAIMNQAGEIQSFIPSWKNSIAAPLREAGFPQKEIDQFLGLYEINQTRRLDSLMEPEFQAIKNASTIQFGGCP